MTSDAFVREQRGVALSMGAALVTAIVVLAFAGLSDRAGTDLPFATRLQMGARIELFTVMWLVAAIANVARLRFFSEDDIAGSSGEGASSRVRRAVAILQNTFEQLVLAVVTFLVVSATFSQSVAIVEALAWLFGVGRLLFWIGYSRGARGRAFGFALTFYPNVLALSGSAVVLLFGVAA